MIDLQSALALGISRREQCLAENIARRLPGLLARRRLQPAFSGFNLTRLSNLSMLLAVLDTGQIGDHNPYTHPDLLHQLSTDLGGLRVYLSNTTGLRYVVLLSPLPKLPRKVTLPSDVPSGRVALGLSFTQRDIVLDWDSLRHLAVLGQTGSGKSVFLRSLVFQALRGDMQLLLADLDQTTFAPWQDHPALLAPIAADPAEALELIRRALGECDYRARLFQSLPGHPEKLGEYNAAAVKHGLEPLRRVLVVLDEASAALAVLGGGRGALGQALAALGWRGRKFGVHFVFGAQEFTKDLVGPVREQVGLAVCFRVRSEEMARRLGCPGASRIPEGRPGLAVTDRFGPMQAYFVDKAELAIPANLLPALTSQEVDLFRRALAEDGRLPASSVRAWAQVSEWQARRLLDDWALKGWVSKDPGRDNAFCLTEKVQALLSNQQTAQTGSNRLEPSQTALRKEFST